MRWLACFWAAVSLALAQSGALLSNQEALKLEQRTVQLIESTGLAVPGLARAGAPALEDARQVLATAKPALDLADLAARRARCDWDEASSMRSPHASAQRSAHMRQKRHSPS